MSKSLLKFQLSIKVKSLNGAFGAKRHKRVSWRNFASEDKTEEKISTKPLDRSHTLASYNWLKEKASFKYI